MSNKARWWRGWIHAHVSRAAIRTALGYERGFITRVLITISTDDEHLDQREMLHSLRILQATLPHQEIVCHIFLKKKTRKNDVYTLKQSLHQHLPDLDSVIGGLVDRCFRSGNNEQLNQAALEELGSNLIIGFTFSIFDSYCMSHT